MSICRYSWLPIPQTLASLTFLLTQTLGNLNPQKCELPANSKHFFCFPSGHFLYKFFPLTISTIVQTIKFFSQKSKPYDLCSSSVVLFSLKPAKSLTVPGILLLLCSALFCFPVHIYILIYTVIKKCMVHFIRVLYTWLEYRLYKWKCS